MNQKEIKQKIRKLKKLELMFRYGFTMDYINKQISSEYIDKLPLVWKDFFDLGSHGRISAKYTLPQMEQMSKDELQKVLDEYWFWVYYQMYQEKGIAMLQVQQPELIQFLGLPYDADSAAIKRRFHELCKAYHPDEGGDQEKFIELMEMMEKYHLR